MVTNRDLTRARKAADEGRGIAIEALKKGRHFWKQASWLTDRFPQGQPRDVEGLVKLADVKEIEANERASPPAATSASPPGKWTKTSISSLHRWHEQGVSIHPPARGATIRDELPSQDSLTVCSVDRSAIFQAFAGNDDNRCRLERL